MLRRLLWCFNFPEQEDQEPLVASKELEKMDNIIDAIDIKIKNLQYKSNEYTLKAQRLKSQNDVQLALTQLKLRNELKITMEKWDGIYLKICRIRHQIEDSCSLQDITNGLNIANQILKLALSKLDPQEVQTLMDDLQENGEHLAEINAIIAEPSVYSDFDAHVALEELKAINEVKVVKVAKVVKDTVREVKEEKEKKQIVSLF